MDWFESEMLNRPSIELWVTSDQFGDVYFSVNKSERHKGRWVELNGTEPIERESADDARSSNHRTPECHTERHCCQPALDRKSVV